MKGVLNDGGGRMMQRDDDRAMIARGEGEGGRGSARGGGTLEVRTRRGNDRRNA